MLSGAAACWLLGMRYVPDDGRIMVLVDRVAPRASVGFVKVVATARLPEPEGCAIRGDRRSDRGRPTAAAPIPVAPAARAALDTALMVGAETSAAVPRHQNGKPILAVPGAAIVVSRALQDVRALLCECVQRGLASADDLARELDEGPRQGSGLARQALEHIVAGARSAPECELAELVGTSTILPPPRLNQPLPDVPGVIPDAHWSEARLVVEIDSMEWHRFGSAPERTEQRRARLAAAGWLVIPVSPRRLRAGPAEVLAEIEAAYVRGCLR